MNHPDFSELLSGWNLRFSEEETDIHIEGSPERSVARAVVCDTDGRRWLLEQIEESNFARKVEIAEQLQHLYLSGLERIHPWKQTADDRFYLTMGSCCWMLRPFVEGIPLNRETYLEDLWRIDSMTEFIFELQKTSRQMSSPVFSIMTYAEDRLTVWHKHYPDLSKKLMGSFKKLKQRFFPVYDQLPVAFCHGDYHPLNVVWGEGMIQSVIDWEFCGVKPELYDVALLLGCFGFDNPDYLISEPAFHLIHNLRSAGFGSDVSWEWLLDLTAVIRYGWMSEWIRRSDLEAQEMEVVYIDSLVDQREYIQAKWNSVINT